MQYITQQNQIKVKTLLREFISGKSTETFIIVLIVLNILAFILGTETAISLRYSSILYWFEIVSIAIFSLEYILRVITAKSIKTLFKPLMLIDFLVLFFYYCSLGIDVRFLWILRLSRIFMILRLERFNNGISLIIKVFERKKEQLGIVIFFFALILLITASLMYFIEGNVQEGFSSIPKALWWSVITFTTVGYGDVYPVTILGKIIATIVAIFGIALYGLITSIFSSGFIEETTKDKE